MSGRDRGRGPVTAPAGSPAPGGAGPVRIGVIGCAEIARRRLLPAFAACPDTEITAVASRDAERAADTARPYGARAFDRYERLLALDEVEAVYVPLPAALHTSWVTAALEAGKHVLAEKPLSTDAASSAALWELSRARGLTLQENVMFLHHPQHSTVRALVAGGAIGEPRMLRASFTVPGRPAGDIRHRSELGGGALLDTGVYPVRLALELLGPGLVCEGAVLTRTGGHDVELSGAALLSTAEGVAAQLQFGLDHAYRSSYGITGSTGTLRLDHAFTPPAGHRPLVRIERAGGTEELRLPAADQVLASVAAFAARVRGPRGAADQEAGAGLLQAGLLDAIRGHAGALREGPA